MNAYEKNVMTIVTLARIVESTLWYCLPPRNAQGFNAKEREERYNALVALTARGTPFFVNCEKNGETGANLLQDMGYFIEDVYGKEGRIVTVDINDVVHVESSLIIELFSTITRLRAFLEAFLGSAMNFLSSNGSLDDDFKQLVETDIRYYHAFAGKVSCVLISQKFIELNQNAKTFTENYSKSHNGINPNQDPEFDVHNDPSFRMIENEFHELNQDMVTVLNSYGQNDPDFRFAREQVYSDCEIFTGKKNTSNLDAYFKMFTSYFDKILSTTQGPLNQMFAKQSALMMADENKPAEVKEEAAAPVEETETKEEDKVEITTVDTEDVKPVDTSVEEGEKVEITAIDSDNKEETK